MIDNKKIGQIISIIIIAIVALLGLFFPLNVGVSPVQDLGSRSIAITQFRAIAVDDNATVGGALTTGGAIVSSGNVTGVDVTASDDVIATDDISGVDIVLTGNETLADWLIVQPQTTISVTSGGVITPTGTIQPLSSGGAVTCDTTTCIAAGSATGQLLILQNVNASDTITIDGTGGTVECKADVVLGAQDTLTLMWNGADWICQSGYDNS